MGLQPLPCLGVLTSLTCISRPQWGLWCWMNPGGENFLPLILHLLSVTGGGRAPQSVSGGWRHSARGGSIQTSGVGVGAGVGPAHSADPRPGAGRVPVLPLLAKDPCLSSLGLDVCLCVLHPP